METFSALLAICVPTQRPVTRSFDVFFDVRPNKQLSKQSWGWWFETLSPPLWRHRNDDAMTFVIISLDMSCCMFHKTSSDTHINYYQKE